MEIIDRQNESDSLMIQATARLLYNRADTIDMMQWIIVITLPLLRLFFCPKYLFRLLYDGLVPCFFCI